MGITVKRLHKLSGAGLLALGAFMRKEVKPESTSEGSDWLCKWQQQGRWSQKQIDHRAELDKVDTIYRVWIAFEGKNPVGLCSVVVEPDALLISAYLIETAGRTEDEQFAIADKLALVALADLPKRKEVHGYFPKEGFAARYATRCGFNSVVPGKPMVIAANPLMRWDMSPTTLEENIKWLQS